MPKRRRSELSTLAQVVVVNAAVILVGAVGGTLVTRQLPEAHVAVLITVYFVCEAALITLANYLVLRRAFRPLMELSRAMASIDRTAAAGVLPSETSPDRDLGAVAVAVSDMLDRLAGESRAYKAKVFESIEDERRRIGRELHDETSPSLAAALLRLDQAEGQTGAVEPAAAERLANSKEIIEHCLGQLRLLVYDLRPSMLDDSGLAPALRWYVETHLQESGLDVTTDMVDLRERLAPAIETALYRICQESLSNVVKHSRATRVALRLTATPQAVFLTVSDDGRGFDPEEVARTQEGDHPGVGLLSIHERVAALRGTVTIDSAPGKGTSVHVVIPRGEEQASAS